MYDASASFPRARESLIEIMKDPFVYGHVTKNDLSDKYIEDCILPKKQLYFLNKWTVFRGFWGQRMPQKLKLLWEMLSHPDKSLMISV